jgi:hypothetical protein
MGAVIQRRPPTSTAVSVQGWLVFAAVAFAPFVSVLEVSGLLGIDIELLGSDLWVFKLPKDVLVLASVGLGIISGFWHDTRVSKTSRLVVFVTFVATLAFSSVYMPVEAIAAGLRWFAPLAFYFTLGRLDEAFIQRLTRLLQWELCAGLALQCYQLAFMSGVYGQTATGSNIRNPGFYLIPSSMASFSMAALYFTTNFETSRRRIWMTYIASVVSVALTASGAGVVSLAMFSISLIGKKEHVAVRAAVAGSIGFVALAMLPALTNREDIFSSLATRMQILFDEIDFSHLAFSSKFGAGTNALYSILAVRPSLVDRVPLVIADSTVTASVMNIGIFFLVATFYEMFIRAFQATRRTDVTYICAFLPFYFTTVIFELFPVNVLLFVALSLILRKGPAATLMIQTYPSQA